MFMKMYDEKKKKDAETNNSNQIKSNVRTKTIILQLYSTAGSLFCFGKWGQGVNLVTLQNTKQVFYF